MEQHPTLANPEGSAHPVGVPTVAMRHDEPVTVAAPAPEPVRDTGVGTERLDQAVVLTLSGELDFSTIDPVRDTVVGALAERPAVAALDLLAVTFFGEAGLALLAEAAHRADPDTSLRIVASGSTLRKLQLTGLDGHLSVYPTRLDALSARSSRSDTVCNSVNMSFRSAVLDRPMQSDVLPGSS